VNGAMGGAYDLKTRVTNVVGRPCLGVVRGHFSSFQIRGVSL
jgi:hypothetical protein